MKLSILYVSKTGKTRQMAEEIAQGMRSVADVEVGVFSLDEIDKVFLDDSRAVVFGTPTYYANTCWQIKKWFDESRDFQLGGKLGAVFATADYPQGGADTAIMNVVGHLLVKGMLVYSGGSAYGQPYIHLGAVALRDSFEQDREQMRVFGKRIAEQAQVLLDKPKQ